MLIISKHQPPLIHNKPVYKRLNNMQKKDILKWNCSTALIAAHYMHAGDNDLVLEIIGFVFKVGVPPPPPRKMRV
jgi:hypothetical protein